MRIASLIAASCPRDIEHHLDRCSLCGALDLERSSQALGALPHAEEPQVLARVNYLAYIKTGAVVRDLDQHTPIYALRADTLSCPACVLEGIGQRLLDQPVCRDLGWEGKFCRKV